MEIKLTQNKVAQIDDVDWPLVAGFTWYAAFTTGGWYAHAAPLDGDRSKSKVKMHNLIAGTKWVDHRDLNGLNNRRENLRSCTNAMNQQNTRPRSGSSRFKGVSWIKSKKRWMVVFRCHGQYRLVGYFADQEQAAQAYDEAILPLGGIRQTQLPKRSVVGYNRSDVSENVR